MLYLWWWSVLGAVPLVVVSRECRTFDGGQFVVRHEQEAVSRLDGAGQHHSGHTDAAALSLEHVADTETQRLGDGAFGGAETVCRQHRQGCDRLYYMHYDVKKPSVNADMNYGGQLKFILLTSTGYA